MNQLSLFFNAGVADQLAVAGQTVTLRTRGSAPFAVRGVLTERSDALQIQVGEELCTLSAHLLLPLSCPLKPQPGMIVRANGRNFTIFGVTRSEHEAAFSCDLSATN